MCSTVTAADATGLKHSCTLTSRICKCLFGQTPRISSHRRSLSVPILTYLFQTGPHSPYSPHLSSETQLPPGFNNLVGHNGHLGGANSHLGHLGTQNGHLGNANLGGGNLGGGNLGGVNSHLPPSYSASNASQQMAPSLSTLNVTNPRYAAK